MEPRLEREREEWKTRKRAERTGENKERKEKTEVRGRVERECKERRRELQE